ncbi:hypothetical protein BGZ61DRAFT_524867 [Ilyonectria robusta]|uniref:uncharacterized protein n=1 Tax=Ilyonectria robusta TaxID=1079257 RepID=UPI001E8DF5EB|nr:uncharacterized protein BGZ61DRAFT_524867 [Ilyonectria robusta]KAH8646027.1 hypothetical protein BGZ61DRAFT_524867 [Ilyonectria robusta]
MQGIISLILLHLSLALSPTHAKEDARYDPSSNLRPTNVSDLTYWLYAWVGSYYNGTTTFKFTPLYEDYENDVCTRFRGQNITFGYDSLLAITETNPDADTENPVRVFLRAWRPTFNLTPPYHWSGTSMQSGLEWQFYTDELNDEPKDGRDTVYWNLSMAESFSQPYYISGSTNDAAGNVGNMQYNMSSCNVTADTWWGISFWDHVNGIGLDEKVTDPQIILKFHNESASFTYQGWFSMNTDPGNDMLYNGDPERNILQGLVTVDFLGSIDVERSDVLNNGEKPSWTRSVGFGNYSLNLGYNSSNDSSPDGPSSNGSSSAKIGNAGTNQLGMSLVWCIFSLFIAFAQMF